MHVVPSCRVNPLIKCPVQSIIKKARIFSRIVIMHLHLSSQINIFQNWCTGLIHSFPHPSSLPSKPIIRRHLLSFFGHSYRYNLSNPSESILTDSRFLALLNQFSRSPRLTSSQTQLSAVKDTNPDTHISISISSSSSSSSSSSRPSTSYHSTEPPEYIKTPFKCFNLAPGQ